jgi:hypothetical protein
MSKLNSKQLSYPLSGSFTGSLFGTSSYALDAVSASFATSASRAISSSFSITASYALNAGTTINTGSFVTTSSFNAYTGSSTSQFAGTSSFAITASHALNGGGSTLSGGTNGYIPLWSGSNALTSSYLNQSGSILSTYYNGTNSSGIFLNLSQSDYKFGSWNTGSFTYIGVFDQSKQIVIDATDLIVIGDNTTSQYGTQLIINDTSQSIKTSLAAIDKGLKLDFAANSYTLGDPAGNTITISDSGGGDNATLSLLDGNVTFTADDEININALGAVALNAANTFIKQLTSTSQLNILTYNSSSGQLYYTASSAFGGGGGPSTPTFPYTGSAIITGSLVVTGSTTSTLGFTGSLFGTASWATNFVSASNYVLNSQTSSFVLNSQTSSFVTNAQTSSFVTNAQTSSFVLNSQTSSFVQNSQTSSFVTNSQTSSFVTNNQTSSFVLNSQTSSMTVATASFVATASWATNAVTASEVLVTDTTSGTGPYYVAFTQGTTGDQAILVDSNGLLFNATTNTLTVTSSFATTASFALTSAGGTGGISQGKVVAIATGYSNIF